MSRTYNQLIVNTFLLNFQERIRMKSDVMVRANFRSLSEKMTTAVARIIEELRSRGGLKGTDIANIASVSPTTVSRWIAGKALPDPQTQLVISDLRYVVDRLAEFYTPDEIRLWLYSKHRRLDGERGIDLINQGDTDKVLTAVGSIDEASCT
jgi:hypothetical protein